MAEFNRPHREPDLEVELSLLSTEKGGRENPLWQGCRLAHDFSLPDEMNDGMYEFIGDPPHPGSTQKALVWLLAPKRNKNRIFPGFQFRVWDGRFIGHGKVVRVINPLLRVDVEQVVPEVASKPNA